MEDDSEDWMEKIVAKKETISENKDNAWKPMAKIGKRCNDIVQKDFFSMNTS